jgi:DNA mismatch repair protein MutS
LGDIGVRSRGLLGLHEYLTGYIHAEAFLELRNAARTLESELDGIRYYLLIKGNRMTVGAFDEEFHYNEQMAATFDRFQQGRCPSTSPISATGRPMQRLESFIW